MFIYKEPLPAIIVWGVIFNREELVDNFGNSVSQRFGKIVSKSEIIPFDYTVYYQKEMGSNLKRQWIVTDKLIPLTQMQEIKLYAIEIEKNNSTGTRRNINVDPGFLTLSNFMLLTTKNYSHRIYLGKGIYAEITLIFSNNTYQPLPWTYPDYRDNIFFFNKVRESLKKLLKNKKGYE
jgi:hypothetical protein